MLVVDHAARVDDVDEQLGGRMRADAGEIGSEVVADVAEAVTGATYAGEEFLALGDIAWFLDLGTELVDEVILGRTRADVELGEDRGGTLGDRLVRVTQELGRLERGQLHRREGLLLESAEHQAGPIGTSHQPGISRLADGAFAADEPGKQRFA